MMPSLDMIQQYAPNVAPQTIAAIIRVESGGNQFAVGVNGRGKLCSRPKTAQQAIAAARYFIGRGLSVDLGLMQINSRNLSALGLTVEQAFDVRSNIEAGAKILTRGYHGAVRRYGPGQVALRAALSAYNTGNYERGFKNGYVAKYFPGEHGQSLQTASAQYSVGDSTVSAKGISYLEQRFEPYKADLSVYRQSEPMTQTSSATTAQVADVADNL